MTAHTLRFRSLCVDETLEPETLAGRPLCMVQFSRMFNSCRVPGETCDSIVTYPHTHRHIAVLRNDRICALQVLDAAGHTLPTTDLILGFEAILAATSTSVCQ